MITATSRRIYFISYYVISVLLLFALFGSIKWLTYVRLMTGGTATGAIVTTTACANSMSFSYRFTVEGKSFAGSGGDGYGNQPCTSLKSGDAAVIYYLAADPGTNIPGDPAARFISEFSAIALVAFFVPILVLLLLFGLMKLWQKQNKSDTQ
jgi:hypothetical protein